MYLSLSSTYMSKSIKTLSNIQIIKLNITPISFLKDNTFFQKSPLSLEFQSDTGAKCK